MIRRREFLRSLMAAAFPPILPGFVAPALPVPIVSKGFLYVYPCDGQMYRVIDGPLCNAYELDLPSGWFVTFSRLPGLSTAPVGPIPPV